MTRLPTTLKSLNARNSLMTTLTAWWPKRKTTTENYWKSAKKSSWTLHSRYCTGSIITYPLLCCIKCSYLSFQDIKKLIRDDPRYSRYSSSDRKCEKAFNEFLKVKDIFPFHLHHSFIKCVSFFQPGQSFPCHVCVQRTAPGDQKDHRQVSVSCQGSGVGTHGGDYRAAVKGNICTCELLILLAGSCSVTSC